MSNAERVTIEGIGEVRILRSTRARRISIAVKPSGEVRLSHPWLCPRGQAVEFLLSRKEWISATRARLKERAEASPAPTFDKAQIEELRRQAIEDLPVRMARLSEATGLTFNRLTIRATRSKWGSCSSRNDISLSLFLMILPEHLRDYVIVHELCHTHHHNHSPQFHSLVDSLVGGRERELNRELKKYHIR